MYDSISVWQFSGRTETAALELSALADRRWVAYKRGACNSQLWKLERLHWFEQALYWTFIVSRERTKHTASAWRGACSPKASSMQAAFPEQIFHLSFCSGACTCVVSRRWEGWGLLWSCPWAQSGTQPISLFSQQVILLSCRHLSIL